MCVVRLNDWGEGAREWVMVKYCSYVVRMVRGCSLFMPTLRWRFDHHLDGPFGKVACIAAFRKGRPTLCRVATFCNKGRFFVW